MPSTKRADNAPRQPTIAERTRQSQRDKALHAQAKSAARMKSIPRGPAKGHSREAMFKAAPTNVQFAPRGHGYYDAFVNPPGNAVTAASIGPNTPVHGFSMDHVSGKRTQDGYYIDPTSLDQVPVKSSSTLILFNPGSSDNSVGAMFSLEPLEPVSSAVAKAHNSLPGEAMKLVSQVLTCRQLSELGPAYTHDYFVESIDDGPDESTPHDKLVTRRVANLPLRGSIRIRNVTETFAIGGSVRFLRLNGGVQLNADPAGKRNDKADSFEYDVGQYLQLCDLIRDSQRTRVLGGDELRAGHQCNSYPVDFVSCMAYRNDVSIYEAFKSPAFCTIAILIDDFTAASNSINNSYEINYQVQRAARFDPSSILGGMQKSLSVNPAHHAAATKAEEAKRAATPLSIKDHPGYRGPQG